MNINFDTKNCHKKNKKRGVEGVGTGWGSHVTCWWGRELNITIDIAQWDEQVVEDKYEKRKTQRNNERHR